MASFGKTSKAHRMSRALHLVALLLLEPDNELAPWWRKELQALIGETGKATMEVSDEVP